MLPTVIILRHAEKQLGDQPPRGVALDGSQDPESLTVRGWQRAGALLGLFVPRSGDAVIAAPTHLFASRVGESETDSRRPIETLEPLSQRLGIPIGDAFMKDQLADLVAAIRACDGPVLVAWEHKRIPPLAALLTNGLAGLPSVWPDDRFDVLWIIEPDHAGLAYGFRQVPQLLLAGDLAQTI